MCDYCLSVGVVTFHRGTAETVCMNAFAGGSLLIIIREDYQPDTTQDWEFHALRRFGELGSLGSVADEGRPILF